MPEDYITAPAPDFTYVLRWWLKEPGDPIGEQSQVVLVRSDRPLSGLQLKSRLECLGLKPERYILVTLPRNCAAVLDTWEPEIELCAWGGSLPQDVQLTEEWCHAN